MINHCFNPACNRALHYLRDGRVVRLIRGKDERAAVEHYWLCGTCYQVYDFVFPPDGTVSLGAKMHREHAYELHFPTRQLLFGYCRVGHKPPRTRQLSALSGSRDS